jgi:hypothetical protein
MSELHASACAIAASYCWQAAADSKADPVYSKYLMERAVVYGDEASRLGNHNHPGVSARTILDAE